MSVKLKSIVRTMIPMDYTEMTHEEWRVYIHNCVCENDLISQANEIINRAPEVRYTEPALTPKQMANGDLVIYAMMFAAAIGIALIITLKS